MFNSVKGEEERMNEFSKMRGRELKLFPWPDLAGFIVCRFSMVLSLVLYEKKKFTERRRFSHLLKDLSWMMVWLEIASYTVPSSSLACFTVPHSPHTIVIIIIRITAFTPKVYGQRKRKYYNEITLTYHNEISVAAPPSSSSLPSRRSFGFCSPTLGKCNVVLHLPHL